MDWIQFPFEVNAKLHNGPGAPVVRLRWVFTDQPFLPLGTNSVINNRIWNEDYYSDLAVGQLPLAEADYVQDARWKLPAFKFDGHQCHPEWFAVGEPWPVPSSLPPTVSLAGWVPECCVMACDFEDCSREPVNGKPASQQRQYTVPVVEKIDGTPFRQSVVAEALESAGGFWPGQEQSFFPLGTLGPPQYVVTDLMQPSGVPFSHEETFHFGAGNSVSELLSADGYALTVEQGGDTGSLLVALVGGVLTLSGVNFTIDPAVLPPTPGGAGQETLAAGGTDQATATAITQSNVTFSASAPPAGLRLPARAGAVVWLKQTLSPHVTTNLYPPVGERINGAAADAPLVIGPFPGHDAVWVATRTDEVDAALPGPYWTVVLVREGASGAAQLNAANLFTMPQTVTVTTPTTGAIQTAVAVQTACTGTPAFGFGAQYSLRMETDTHTMRPAADLAVRWFSAVDATRRAQFFLRVWDTVSRNVIIASTDGTAPTLGFFGVGATARPTAGGSTAGFTNGAAATVTADATFTGGGAGGAYTIDDIVFALKSLGLLS